MTRIIGGVLGSLRLKGPAKVTRPTSDRVKESVFSILESMSAIDGANVVDLFAGTGALGLEAASRGAGSVVLVEKDRDAAQVCRHNLELLSTGLIKSGVDCHLQLKVTSVSSYIQSMGQADLVFMDPPYDLDNQVISETLDLLGKQKNCLVVLEQSTRVQGLALPSGLVVARDASYGDTRVLFLTTGDAL